MRFNIIATIFLTFTAIFALLGNVYSQREADRWYFGHHCGLNFNSGEPEVLSDGRIYSPFIGIGTISDSLGNLLFYSEADTIFTAQHTVMENGLDFLQASGEQSNLIVQWPESDSLYFVFKAPNLPNIGVSYNIVDISKNNGLGAVIEKDILLNYAWDAGDKVTATLHKNKRDIWVVTRKYREDSYAVFLITPNGINEIPGLYPAPELDGDDGDRGIFKFSYDKKYLLANYYIPRKTEICSFNDETGEIEFLYELNIGIRPLGIEYSPDSKFAYIYYQQGSVPGVIKQYNMEYVENGTLFMTSSIEIGNNLGYGLQLATDGKIYCIDNTVTTPNYFVGVINKPWELGTACDYKEEEINMYPGETSHSLPNIFMGYLYRFEFEGLCAGTPFQFTSNFNPVPDSIRWLFNDPGSGFNNISNELNPVHIFSDSGIYEVEVDVWYPSGRFEHTSREVEVAYTPTPELGPDTLVCEGASLTLNAGTDEGMYVWSTGTFGQNIFSITVSDTGTYWVTVSNSEGCSSTDSIHVGWFNKAVFNEDNMVITPTSCGENNGSIMGILVEGIEPFNYSWYDGDGNLISNDIDITDLSVGNYYLHVTDGNGCLTISNSYTIVDAGDILITSVDTTPSHCMQNTGSISITASSGTGNDFEYSIDNGNTWQSGNLFTDLSSGNYFIRVKDQSGCESVYENNPVVIQNIEGPQLVSLNLTPETDYTSNGQIDIYAIVPQGSQYYSIDGGSSFQTNNGLFSGLTAGTYTCVIQDDFGCDTTFTIVLERIISQIIDAIAGDGYTCIGNATASPLILSNFNDVYRFDVMLTYDKDLIVCDGYIQVHPDLEDGFQVSIVPAMGEVYVTWQGESPTSLPDNSLMAELVFSGIAEGLSQIDWIAEQGESQFYNENGEIINADFELGFVIIYSRPEIKSLPPTSQACEGEYLWITPYVIGGTGVAQTHWTGPNNYTSDLGDLFFTAVISNMAGTYTLTVTDTINCVESGSIELIVNQGLAIAFAPTDTLWVEPGFILDAGQGASVYAWNTGDSTSSIEIDTTGLYQVELISFEGCKSLDSVQILFGGDAFYLPNAFTPNGDGLNDTFSAIPKYDYVNKYHMSIFNRWGQKIFETKDINNGWDGTFAGSPCMQGTYVYQIIYSEIGNQPQQSKIKQGILMLVR